MKKEKIEYESSPLAKDFVLSPFSFGKNDRFPGVSQQVLAKDGGFVALGVFLREVKKGNAFESLHLIRRSNAIGSLLLP